MRYATSCRSVLLGAVAAAALVITPAYRGHEARAQLAVVCPTCDQAWTQVLAYGKQIESVAQEIQTVQNTLRMYSNMIQNTLALPMSVYSQVTARSGN